MCDDHLHHHSAAHPDHSWVCSVDELYGGQRHHDDGSGGAPRLHMALCAKHNKRLKLFCHDCDTPVCHICAVLPPCKPHTHAVLPTVAMLHHALADHIRTMRDMSADMAARLDQARAAIADVHNRQSDIIAAIHTHIGALHALVDAHGADLVAQATAKCDDYGAMLGADMDEMVATQARLDKMVEDARRVVDSGSDVEMVRTMRAATGAMDAAKHAMEADGRRTTTPPQITFCSDVADRIGRAIAGAVAIAGGRCSKRKRHEMRRSVRSMEVARVVRQDVEHAYGMCELSDGTLAVSRRNKHCIEICDKSDGRVVRSMDSHGSGVGKLNCPGGMVADGHGNIYVCNAANNRIVVYGATGDVVRSIGGKGTGPAQFDLPEGIAMSDDGLFYITDCDNHRVQVMTAEGEHVRTIGKGMLQHPTGIAIDDDRDPVYVAEYGRNQVRVLTKVGHAVSTIAIAPSNCPRGIVVDRKTGNIAVACESGGIQVYTPDGTRITCLAPDHVKYCTSLAVDGDYGGLWAACRTTKTIVKLM